MIQGAVFHVERFHKSPKTRLLIVTFLGLYVIDSVGILLVFIQKVIQNLCMLFAVQL